MVGAWYGSENVLTWSATELDRSDQGFEIALGYQFSRHLALEGAYIDFGDIAYQVPMAVGPGTGELSDAMTTTVVGRRGPALSLVGTLPVAGSLSVDVRAGAFLGESTAKVAYGLAGETPSHAESTRRNTRAFAGAGLNWSLSPKTAIRLGYTRAGKDALVHHDTNRISFGVKVAF